MTGPESHTAASSRPGVRAVLFDAGDTLIHMPLSAEEILTELCQQLGVAISPEQAREACLRSQRYYVRHYLSYSGDQGAFWLSYHAEALRYLGIDDPTGEKAAHLSHGFGLAGVWQPFPEAHEACQRLRDAGLRMGVISNGPVNVVDMLAQAGLLHFFETVVTSQGARVEKPDPRIFTMALQEMGIHPDEALFVGDLYEVDVLGARAAGMAGVLIDRRGRGETRDCPVIRGLDELFPLLTM